MSMTDPIGDMIARIRNAAMRKRATVATPASQLRQRVLDGVKLEGFLGDLNLPEPSLAWFGRSPELIEQAFFNSSEDRFALIPSRSDDALQLQQIVEAHLCRHADTDDLDEKNEVIAELMDLHRQGLISDEEFSRLRLKALGMAQPKRDEPGSPPEKSVSG